MDPLFSEKNKVKGGPRGDMPGGRMKWYMLKEGKCPRCGYMLETDEERRFMRCENPHCSFGITAQRMKGIVDSMLEEPRDEESNQRYLNNLEK